MTLNSPNGVRGVLRASLDVGLLSNVRMGAEIATGLAFLTGRRLSMPFDQPVPPAPRSSMPPRDQGRPATLLDLFELPIDIVHGDEWDDPDPGRTTERLEWCRIADAYCLCDDDVEPDDPQLLDFANGRTRALRLPHAEADVVEVDGRLLSFYSYFFYTGRPAVRRQLHAVLQNVRPRRPFVELGATIAAGIGGFNAVHIRRSDLTIGIPAYGNVTPDQLARNLPAMLPPDEPLLVCSEVDAGDELFDPVRRLFPAVMFANDLILRDHRESFFSLPRHEDNALGLVTQDIASRAHRFAGTIGSTFTAMIHRQRVLRDPTERFLYTADFTPHGPCFRNGEFIERVEGCYSWNRIGYAMSADALAWMREWPECR